MDKRLDVNSENNNDFPGKKDEGEFKEVLNIYGPEIWHDDVVIVGTEESLRELRDNVDRALKEGKSKVKRRASDKKPYLLHVLIKDENDSEWSDLEVPYQNEIAIDDSKKVTKQDLIG